MIFSVTEKLFLIILDSFSNDSSFLLLEKLLKVIVRNLCPSAAKILEMQHSDKFINYYTIKERTPQGSLFSYSTIRGDGRVDPVLHCPTRPLTFYLIIIFHKFLEISIITIHKNIDIIKAFRQPTKTLIIYFVLLILKSNYHIKMPCLIS